MNLLQLSWKNLLHKPLNMALSLLLFALGVGLISLLWNMNRQIERNFETNFAGIHLVVGAKGSPLQLILSSMYHVDNPTGNVKIGDVRPFLNPKHPFIEQAVPLSLGDSYKGHRIVGTNHELVQLYGAAIAEGKLWEENLEVTIGSLAARRLNLKPGDTFKGAHGLVDGASEHEHDFKVVGILQPSGSVVDQLLLTNTQSIWEVHGHQQTEATEVENADSVAHRAAHAEEEIFEPEEHPHEHEHETEPTSLLDEPEKEITSILVRIKKEALTNPRYIQMLNEFRKHPSIQVTQTSYEVDKLLSNFDAGTKAMNALGWVIVGVSGLSIFISLFSSLKERKYELALMRVMGGSPGTLFNLILLEGLLLAVLGYVLGIVFSHVGLTILGNLMEDKYKYSFNDWQFLTAEIWLLAGALAVGFVAAVIPAWQAKRTDISKTLAQG